MVVVFISSEDVILRVSWWYTQHSKVRKGCNIKHCAKMGD